MACECIEKVNADLRLNGRRLVTAIVVGMESSHMSQRTIVETERCGEKRSKSFHVSATFCPFCGTRYVERTPTPEVPS